MVKYFCVSDIHSYYNELMVALDDKNFDINDRNHKLIVCGDAFDRGPDSIKVFELMKKLHKESRLIYIKGNHEDLIKECVRELATTGNVGGHHYSNGTLKTLSHFIEEDDYWLYSTYIPTNIIKSIIDSTKELFEFIDNVSTNYFKLGDKIFVHSWIPNDLILDYNYDDNLSEEENLENKLKYEINWRSARWGNPFEQAKLKFYPKDKCIVFGHWHTSWYWSHIKMERKEWPQKNQKNWIKSFDPVIEKTIIGLDSCVAYSGKLNCIVFNESGEIIS